MTQVIYHGNCADGFGAALAAKKFFEGYDIFEPVEFVKGIYGQEPPDVTDKQVIILDFSYKRDVLQEMASKAKGILILDHHKSAEEDLREGDFILRLPIKASMQETLLYPGKVVALFDMNRSGAGIAWDFFFPARLRPRLIDHIEDRDLWKFKLECTREISSALFSYEYEFGIWENLLATFEADPWTMIHAGEALERKHFKDIRELLKESTRRAIIGGYNVPIANLPYTMSSDAGSMLAKGEPFAACYSDGVGVKHFSLRSTNEGVDVSVIAKQYGGGGHRNASGFRVSFAEANAFEIIE